jgi:hypothetical protein
MTAGRPSTWRGRTRTTVQQTNEVDPQPMFACGVGRAGDAACRGPTSADRKRSGLVRPPQTTQTYRRLSSACADCASDLTGALSGP